MKLILLGRFEKNPTEMILKNWFVMAPMRHHEPRGPLAAPCQDQEESSISNGTVPVSTTTSSFQLLEGSIRLHVKVIAL